MNASSQFLAIGLISFAAAGATFAVKGAPKRYFICDPKTLLADEICLTDVHDDGKILWVDARIRSDWQKNGVTGSLLWSLDTSEDQQAFEAEIAMRLMDSPIVIVYCGNENCGLSRQVADKIRQLGLGSEVKILKGGWRALHDAGRVKNP